MMNSMIRCLIILPLVMTLGCKKEPEQPQPEKPQPATSAEDRTPAAPPLPRPADTTQDDPLTYPWLPAPESTVGWIRTSTVDVFLPGEWQHIQDDRLLKCLDAYAIKSIGTFEMHSITPHPPQAEARVIIVEAYNPEDAMGVFTSLSGPDRDQQVGSLSSITQQETQWVGYCWQGLYCIQTTLKPALGLSERSALARLMASMVAPIPSTDPPALINLLPPQQLIDDQLWVIRKHLQGLPQEIQKLFPGKSAMQNNETLELSLDTLMVVAAYDVENDEEDNYIWLIQYPTPQDAQEAHTRYTEFSKHVATSTPAMIEKPVGRYLFGSWTAGQESILHVLPKLSARLEEAGTASP